MGTTVVAEEGAEQEERKEPGRRGGDQAQVVCRGQEGRVYLKEFTAEQLYEGKRLIKSDSGEVPDVPGNAVSVWNGEGELGWSRLKSDEK